MKFKLINVIFLILFSSFVQFKTPNSAKVKTEFSETCLKISNEYKTETEHGRIYNDKTKKYLNFTEFSKILKKVSEYDLDKNLEYNIALSQNGKIKRIVWKPISKKDKIISLEMLTFKTIIEQEYDGKKYKNEFTIVEYTIRRNVAPKKIYLRVMENEFEKLTIDGTNYAGLFESRLIGIDDAKEELDKLLNK